MEKKGKKKPNGKEMGWILGGLGFLVLFLGAAVIFRVFEFEILPSQFYGALIGVVITAIITVFLLYGQTTHEEKREKNVKIFEKKQEVYHNFLDKLHQIVQKGEITIGGYTDEGKVDSTVGSLKNLIFQLGYLQMHASNSATNTVLESLGKIIQQLKKFAAKSDSEKRRDLSCFFDSLFDDVFNIVAALKNDLYGKREDEEEIKKENVSKVLMGYIDQYGVQAYFWDELQNLLEKQGYKFERTDFESDVNKYYARKRNRHRYYGLSFLIQTSTMGDVQFGVSIENEIYYGFEKGKDSEKNERIRALLKEAGCKVENDSNEYWLSAKFPDRYRLDFWRMDSEGFKALKDPDKRKEFMENFFKEMQSYIDQFRLEAEKQLNQ